LLPTHGEREITVEKKGVPGRSMALDYNIVSAYHQKSREPQPRKAGSALAAVLKFRAVSVRGGA
jgi:hypothetical protein